MTIEIGGFILSAIIFIATVVGWAVKYGSDQQKLRSKNDMQDLKIDMLEKSLVDEKAHNAKQHEEFYQNKSVTIELKNDMKHIMAGIEEIKLMVGDRRQS